MAQLVEKFAQAISQVVDIRAVNQDITIKATITKIVDTNKGEYKISYQSNIFSAFSQDPETTYKEQDTVYVLIPQGDFSQTKVILMLASSNKTYLESLEEINYYTDTGIDLVNIYPAVKDNGSICACPEEKRTTLISPAQYNEVLFTRDTTTDYTEADEKTLYYGTRYEYVKVAARFKTAFNQTHSQGNYGIRVYYLVTNPNYKDPTAPDYDPLISQYEEYSTELGFASFTGEPYQYSEYVLQTAYFQIPTGSIQKLDKIEFFQDGNFILDNRVEITESGGTISTSETPINFQNNIFCKDLSISYAEKVNLNDGLYHCWISVPYGTDIGITSQEVVYLVPHLYYKNADCIDSCEVRWFRRRSDIMNQTPTSDNKDKYNKVWTDYTGPGWEPIENILDDGYGTKWHEIQNNTLIVYQAGVVWQWDYKCVCIYNDGELFYTAEQTVTNSASSYDLVIEDFTDPNRHLYINNLNKNVKSYDLDADPSSRTFNRHWFGRWYVYLPSGSYTPIKVNSDYLIEGPIDVTSYLKNSVVTFRVQCYDPYIIDPDGLGNYVSCKPIGEMEYTIVNNEENAVGYWEGDTSFNYDANGKAKNSLFLTDSHVQLILQFPSVDGVQGGGYYGVDFYAPDGTQLYTSDIYESFSNDGQAYDPENSMLRDMYIDETFTVHFKVKEEFNGSLTDNTITAKVKYYTTDSVYELTCPITFTKDGEQGTQGSDWVAPIYPCNSEPYLTNNQTEGKTLLKKIKEAFAQAKESGSTTFYYTDSDYQKFLQVTYSTAFKGDNGVRVPTWDNYKTAINAALSPKSLIGDTITTIQDYHTYRTDQWLSAKPNDIIPSFFQREELPDPIILIKDTDGKWIQDPDNHVYFRPFVAKNGTKLEEMNPYEGYFYRVWWDVRFDGSHEKLPLGSLLRLHHVTDHAKYLWATTTDSSAAYEWGGAEKGKCCEYRIADTEVEYLEESPGLCGFNAYPSKNLNNGVSSDYAESYGAIEVRFADAQNKLDKCNIEDLHYIFFVKARIEIYKNGYDYEKGGINPDKSDAELVSTITSWHPVDVFLNPNSNYVTFNKSYFKTNLPSFVIYDTNGQNPVLNVANNSTAELYAYYSSRNYSTDDYVLYEDELNMPILNNTPGICHLQENKKSLTKQNAGVDSTEKVSYTYQSYQANDSLTWQRGMISSLITKKGAALDHFGIDQWQDGQYIRCQIFTLNTYGNSQINGWDGESITTNDGTLFAPTIGAGYKDKASNSFTGMLMGIDTQWKKKDLSKYLQEIHGYDEADMKAHPYLAGLYGYQRGKATFGLMENGTAFFGRADRGGRIIIDGYHATIYGGGNGVLDHPEYNDPMWNSMRLNLVDLNHPTDSEKAGNAVLGFDGHFFEDSDFPEWFKKSWRRAYVVADKKNAMPYWALTHKDSTGKEVRNDYEYLTSSNIWYGDDTLLNQNKGWSYTYSTAGTQDGIEEELLVPYNAPINYWDNSLDSQDEGSNDRHKWTILTLQQWLTRYIGEQGSTKRKNYLTDIETYVADFNLALLEQTKDATEYAKGGDYAQYFDQKKANLQVIKTAATEAINLRVQNCKDLGETSPTIIHFADVKESKIESYIFDYLLSSSEDPISCASRYSSTLYPVAARRKAVVAKELFGCDSWAEMIRHIVGDNGQYLIEASYTWLTDNCRVVFQRSCFGPSRASTTPAIEIGQHIPGLRPGKIGIEDYHSVMSNLSIPGDRNFMVTYDGTMWAMNGVFMGNIVGSNIIGGSIVGAEVEIGENQEGASYWKLDKDNLCDWAALKAPVQTETQLTSSAAISMKDGVINAAQLNIYGGNIDIGGFHVIGGLDEEAVGITPVDSSMGAGHLVQFGESDFIGPTHIYGNIGIGPNLNTSSARRAIYETSNYGNLFQTYGNVGLGIVLPNKSDLTFHEFMAGNKGTMGGNGIQYKAEDVDDPSETARILDQAGEASIQDYAMFGLDTSSEDGLEEATYRGHFWPLAFVTKNEDDGDRKIYGIMTTMDDFLLENSDVIVDGMGKQMVTNYFRVGNWGAECNEMFFRDGYLTEDECGEDNKPLQDQTYQPVIGFCGLRSLTKWGDHTSWEDPTSSERAVGMSSWNLNHIVIKSDLHTYILSRRSSRIYGSAFGSKAAGTSTWTDDTDDFGAFLLVGATGFEDGETAESANTRIHRLGGAVTNGNLSFGVRLDGYNVSGKRGCHAQNWFGMGIDFDPFNAQDKTEPPPISAKLVDTGNQKGAFLYTRKMNGYSCGSYTIDENSFDIHIVKYKESQTTCISGDNPEIWIGEKCLSIYHDKELNIFVDGHSAHDNPSNGGITLVPGKITFKNIPPINQEGIYARFA